MVKDASFIISDTTSSNERVIVIKRSNLPQKRETKLGDVFYSLPHGLIHKEETGLGATTLELAAERDSIIVEPIRITAYSKAVYHSKHNEPALYVRGQRDGHGEATTNNEILSYINSDNVYKKY